MKKVIAVVMTLLLLIAAVYLYIGTRPQPIRNAYHMKTHTYQKTALHPKTSSEGKDPDEQADTTEYIKGVPIGKKVTLAVSQSLQETNYYCVPAVVQMALRYRGIEVDQSTLAEKMKTHPVTGTEYADMAVTLNTYLFQKGLAPDNEPGYHIQTVAVHDRNPQIRSDFERRVIEDIDTGYPVFIAVNTTALYPEIPTANHMILVKGYALHKDSDQIAFYYILDPYEKVQDPVYGGEKVFSSEELMEALITNEEPAYLW